MEMRKPYNERGQSSVYDAMIFLSIMLVASTLITAVSTHLLRADEVRGFEELEKYSIRYANAVLSSTVPSASYKDSVGSNVTSSDISVRDMVIEELVLLRSGISEENFEGPHGYNERITRVMLSLLDKDRFDARLHGQYGECEVAFSTTFSQTYQEEDIAASTARILVPEAENEIVIIVYVWWK